MDIQLELNYGAETRRHADEISERIANDGADRVTTLDLAKLLFDNRAAAAITAIQDLVAGKGDLHSIPVTDVHTIAALELTRRITCNRSCSEPSDIFNVVRHYAYDNPHQEHFIVVTLDGSHSIIRPRLVSTGLVNRTLAHPREVFAPALEDRAAAVIVAHNHPSGHLEPSTGDLEVTARLRKAGELMGIPVLDHIIFSQDSFRSLAESGELQ